jgi:hypothetical protein
MFILNAQQLQFESDSWKRLLSYITDENIQLKYRIAAMLNNGFDKKQLETIEGFQNQFIREDMLISLLRNEVAEMDRLLTTEKFDNSKIADTIKNKLSKIRTNIAAAACKMANLKQAFNDYILKVS